MRLTPPGELRRRIEKLQSLLRKNGVDGAVIVQNADLFYFAGTVQQSHLYIPAEGKPVLMVRKSLARAVEESALEEVVPLTNIKYLPEILESYGHGDAGTLGFELDVLPASQFLRYRKLLDGYNLADISSLVREARMVKSRYEIDKMKEAARINSIVFSQVKNLLREGMTELELAGKIEEIYRREGHQCFIRMRGFNREMAYGHLMSGANLAVPSFFDGPTGGMGANPSFPQGAGHKRIGRNEPVMVDYVSVYDGYMVDQTRMFCIGQLSPGLKRAHHTALMIQEEIKAMARPGVLCEDLYDRALDIAGRAGLGENFMGLVDRAPFVGHGVGIELDEMPVLARGRRIPLETGMTLAIEPKFVFDEGAVGIENTFVVGEGGLENLTEFEEDIICV
ncbi:MAG: M24 family metallopeptidase [Bacillota bacterium]